MGRSIVTIIAQCILLLIADRRFFKRTFPKAGYGARDAPAVTHHMVDFMLGARKAR